VKTPVLVLGAAEDNIISHAEVEDTARAYETKAVIISDMAHDMMLDGRWETSAQRIRDWLREQGL
jgi:alpha-beta hydrolase superfamily lysophospholipase